MAGACGCESCCQLPGRPAGRFEGFEGGQTAGSNALKERWLGHVAARVVAGCLGLWSSDAIVAMASDERAKFHTSGDPRRRHGLSEGRGRRTYVFKQLIGKLHERTLLKLLRGTARGFR